MIWSEPKNVPPHVYMRDDNEGSDTFGDFVPVFLPTKIVVCHRCGGRGVHDCWEGGMTRDEMDEQGPEFFDDYMAGVYDKVCDVCHGRNVEKVVDEEACDPVLLAAYIADCEQEAADAHTRWAESGYGQW